jgi:hypothetical protein
MSGRTARRIVIAVVLLGAGAASVATQAQRSATTMQTAASKFLASLTPEQRQRATFPFDGQERFRWNFIPTENFPRNGLLIKDMTEAQRAAAYDVLKSGLSARGYQTYTAIIQLEKVLHEIEQGRAQARDPELYRFSIFGTPGDRGTWGWRVEGHHVSVHYTVLDGKVIASTPSFTGSNPAEVREGPQKGTRILAQLEDTGRAVVMALDMSQRGTAVLSDTAPGDILTAAKVDITPLSPAGLAHASMTQPQRDLLMKVIDAYAGLMADDIAADRMSKIRAAGLDKVSFAWAGPLERGQKHYYRVQGPTFLIEFDNTQGNGNHVHAVWRDFNGDWGRDVLREHLKTSH